MSAVTMIGPKFYAWHPDTGLPLAGGKVYTYEAGTVTEKATFTTEAGDVENTNPVILNAAGYASIKLDGSYKIVVKDASDVEIWSENNVSDASQLGLEWIIQKAATQTSATTFTLAGNQTAQYHSGRRIKFIDSSTIYGIITSSSYSGGITTVIASIDSAASLTASLSSVYVSIISGIGGPTHVTPVGNITSTNMQDAFEELDAEIAANGTNIATNAADIATNAADIVTNAADIVTNATDMATNAANIATNAAGIATNVVDITALAAGQSSGLLAYATQAILYADLTPADQELAYVTNDTTAANNGYYRKSGATGVGSWVQATDDRLSSAETDIAHNVEKINQTLPAESARNLFDIATAIAGYRVNSVGNLVADAAYTASQSIPVEPSTAYTFNTSVPQLAYYDKNNVAISYSTSVTGFTTPATAYYVIFSTTNSDIVKKMLVGGSSIPSTFLSFGFTDARTAKRLAIEDSRALVDTFKSAEFNLFDKNAILSGYALATNGTTYVNAAYFVTDYLEITPGGQFVTNKASNSLSYYDENKSFVSNLTSVVSGTPLTVPVNAYFARIHFTPISSAQTVMIVEGATIPPYYRTFGFTNEADAQTERTDVSRNAVDENHLSDRNTFDKSKALDDYTVSSVNGIAYATANWGVTSYIPVTPGDFFCSNTSTNSGAYYDVNKVYISGFTSITNPMAVPADVYYVRFQYYLTATKEGIYTTGNDVAPVGYKVFGGSADLPWQGLSVAWQGDSITYSGLFISEALSRTGLDTLSNFSAAGRSVRGMHLDPWGVPLVSGDLASADIMHILGGTNDYGGNRSLGTIADAYTGSTVATFYNDVFQLLETLYTLKPSIRIVFSTPTIRGAYSTQPVYPAANSVGATLPEYVAAIKEICALFGTQVCDLFGESGINLVNLTTTTSDNLHWNATGAALAARKMAGTINSV